MANKAVQLANNLDEIQTGFGPERSFHDLAADQSMARLLLLRLSEKSKNYDRAASRLEFRGDADSAQVLRKAATRLRSLTRSGG